MKEQNAVEVFFHGHKTKSIMFGHTHKKILLKIFNYFFLSIFSLLLKKILPYVCVTKHYFFGHVTILKFLNAGPSLVSLYSPFLFLY